MRQKMQKEIKVGCCICKHFRMWKPQMEYCTLKKIVVDPLKENEPCFVLRKGLKDIRGNKLKDYQREERNA